MREAALAYIQSQRHEGWKCLPTRYDDGGFTGGNMDRPALKRLLADVEAGKIDSVITTKVDRLSRSLLDFARIIGIFEKHHVSFVSITQQFNSATSMGRLILNVLLSFAQFEREIISERTRDKIAATRRKGKWSGGFPVLGYDVDKEVLRLVVNPKEAVRVRTIFDLYGKSHKASRVSCRRCSINEPGNLWDVPNFAVFVHLHGNAHVHFDNPGNNRSKGKDEPGPKVRDANETSRRGNQVMTNSVRLYPA
jgi:DNA invertase Pin-like site-specific DNA recombinase